MADIVIHPKIFMLFAAAGMVSALLYAILRGLRGSRHHHPVWTGFLDLLFCFILVILFGACSAYTLEGEIRFFSLLAYAAGFAAFYAGPGAALSKTVYRMVSFVLRIARKGSQALNRVLEKHRQDE